MKLGNSGSEERGGQKEGTQKQDNNLNKDNEQIEMSYCKGNTWPKFHHVSHVGLPSKTSLLKWGKEEEPSYSLCKNTPQIMRHVLCSCKLTLAEGRYAERQSRMLGANSFRGQIQSKAMNSALNVLSLIY